MRTTVRIDSMGVCFAIDVFVSCFIYVLGFWWVLGERFGRRFSGGIVKNYVDVLIYPNEIN